MNEHEEWRPVVGYEGIYEVSSFGNMRSLDRITIWRGINRRLKGRAMISNLNKRSGHLHITLSNGARIRKTTVHRVVAEAFLGEGQVGLEVCHNDGNGSHNHVTNLRWDTRSSNALDAVTHGTHPSSSKTECKRGHLFTEKNTIRKNGRRICSACYSAWLIVHAEQRREARRMARENTHHATETGLAA